MSLSAILYCCFLTYFVFGLCFIAFSPYFYIKKTTYFYHAFLKYLNSTNVDTGLQCKILSNIFLRIRFNKIFLFWYGIFSIAFFPIFVIYDMCIHKHNKKLYNNYLKFIQDNYSEEFSLNKSYNDHSLPEQLLFFGCASYRLEKILCERVKNYYTKEDKS